MSRAKPARASVDVRRDGLASPGWQMPCDSPQVLPPTCRTPRLSIHARMTTRTQAATGDSLDPTARTLVERLRWIVFLHWTAGSILFLLTIALWTTVPVVPGLGAAFALIATVFTYN